MPIWGQLRLDPADKGACGWVGGGGTRHGEARPGAVAIQVLHVVQKIRGEMQG